MTPLQDELIWGEPIIARTATRLPAVSPSTLPTNASTFLGSIALASIIFRYPLELGLELDANGFADARADVLGAMRGATFREPAPGARLRQLRRRCGLTLIVRLPCPILRRDADPGEVFVKRSLVAGRKGCAHHTHLIVLELHFVISRVDFDGIVRREGQGLFSVLIALDPKELEGPISLHLVRMHGGSVGPGDGAALGLRVRFVPRLIPGVNLRAGEHHRYPRQVAVHRCLVSGWVDHPDDTDLVVFELDLVMLGIDLHRVLSGNQTSAEENDWKNESFQHGTPSWIARENTAISALS